MESNAIVIDALGRIQNTIRRVLDGMTPDQLYYRPAENSNSTAWVIWHLTRVQDHHISDMGGLEQLWTSYGWHARFGMEADGKNTGTGHTPGDVAKIRPDAETLQSYYDAVYERTKTVLSSLTSEDMDRELDEPVANHWRSMREHHQRQYTTRRTSRLHQGLSSRQTLDGSLIRIETDTQMKIGN